MIRIRHPSPPPSSTTTASIPLISAIISTYNAERFMRGRLADLEAQTIADRLEIIVIDSGSHENERDIVTEFQSRNPNIIYLRTDECETIYAAWNRGVQAARGVYLTNANTDDRLRHDALAVLSGCLNEHPEVDVVYGRQLVTSTPNQTFDTATIVDRHDWPEFSTEALLEACCVGSQPMWRRKLHDQFGLFDASLHVAGDYEFWLRVWPEARFHRVDEYLGLYYRSHAHENKEFQDRSGTVAETYRIQRAAFMRHALTLPEAEVSEVLRQAGGDVTRELTGLSGSRQVNPAQRRHIEYLYWKIAVILELRGEGVESRRIARDFFDILNDSYRLAYHLKEISVAVEPLGQFVEGPRVSVIIPCHDSARDIVETLQSVAAQTYRNCEIVVVDDGSTDETGAVVADFSANAPTREASSLSVLTLRQERCGPAAARNRGVAAASGDFLLFLDADDQIAADFIAKTVAALQAAPSVAGVFTEAVFYGAKNKIWALDDFSLPALFCGNQMTVTVLLRRSAWNLVGGFDESLEGYEDWDMWISLAEKGCTFKRLPEPLFFYRHRSTSRNYQANERDVALKRAIMRKHPAVYEEISDTANSLLGDLQRIPIFFVRPEWGGAHRDRPVVSSKTSIVNRKPRVLFVCHDFPPHRHAGAQLFAQSLARTLNALGRAEVEVIYPVFRERYPVRYEIRTSLYEGLRVHEVTKEAAGEPGKVYDPAVFEALVRFLKSQSFDVMHIHGLGQITLAPIHAARTLGIKTVMTLHDFWMLCDRWHLIRKDQSFCTGPTSLEKCAQCFVEDNQMQARAELSQSIATYEEFRRNAMLEAFGMLDRVYAPSIYLASVFESYGMRGIVVNPYGLEYQPPPVSRVKHATPFVFGYAGQLIPRKGVNYLIVAFKLIPGEGVRLDIWGSGTPSDDYGNEIARLTESDSRIRLCGEYRPERVGEILSTFDVAVVPTLMDNYPIVVQEAFVNRIPVIATRVGGVPELVHDGINGLLVNAGSSQDLRCAMLRVLHEPELLARLAAGIAHVKSMAEDAEVYAQGYEELRGSSATVNRSPSPGMPTDPASPKPATPSRAPKKRVMVYFFKNVHVPMLMPIYRAIKRLCSGVDIGFGYLPHAPQIRAGFAPEEVRQLTALGEPMFAVPQEFAPHVTIIADAVYPWTQGCGKWVNVGHGVLSKGQYYTNTALARREEQADLVCVPGEYHQEVMRRVISKPVIATGMAKLDDVFSGRLTRESAARSLGLSTDHRFILFAPTFNDELSAIPCIGERIIDALPPGEEYRLIVKLHGSTKQEYCERYRTLARRVPRVLYADGLDITPLLAVADVMVSDVSSAMMEFAALDKPVVLFNNPRWREYANFNPTDIEFQWRDMGAQVGDIDEMREAVAASLQNPWEHSDKRRDYADRLFANKYDGRAAERIAQLVVGLLA